MKKVSKYITLLIIVIFPISNKAFGQCAQDVPQSERDALIAFYNATGGANWTNNTNWNTTACVSDWYGVTVANFSVVRINLQINSVSGTISDVFTTLEDLPNLTNITLRNNQISGSLPSLINGFTNLHILELSNNNISGVIPDTLKDLVSLENLNLAGNDLNGNIPSWIGNNLSILKTLHLGANDFDGQIPTSIGNISSLEYLNLQQNNLSGNIPSSLQNLSNLKFLYLDNNNIDGNIPSWIGSFSNLQILDLASCLFTGNIPNSIGGLSNLTHLDLGNNINLSVGTIPDSFGNLSSLLYLRLNRCNLEGNIPDSLGNLSNLLSFYMPWNDLSGNIPTSLGNLTSLTTLTLMGNELDGIIPHQLGQLSNLQSVYLYNNELEGAIPIEFENLTNLQQLYVYGNHLSGKIPDFRTLTNFDNFIFSSNNFIFSDFEVEHQDYSSNLTNYTYNPQAKVDQEETVNVTNGGSITLTSNELTSINNSYQWYKDGVAITGATNKDYVITNASASDAGVYHFLATSSIITGLTLERHPITLTVSESTCSVPQSEKDALIALYNATDGSNWTNTLANNQPWDVDGTLGIPVCDWYGVTVTNGSVTNLVLSNNGLTGAIPANLNGLLNLKYLFLNSNQLSGNIPSEIGDLSELITLQLTSNQLAGNIPPSLGNLSNLEYLRLDQNMLTGTIPSQLGNNTSLDYINMASNQLSCNIPTSFGNLLNLTYLQLDRNNLTGPIPSELGNIGPLEQILLWSNQLSGSIPASLGNLSNLKTLYLHQNNLTGSIPIQFENLSSLTSLLLNLNQLEGNIPSGISLISGFTNNFQFGNNAFIFNDFESEHNTYSANIGTYLYSPQAKVDQEDAVNVTSGGSITLTSNELISTNNNYQWYKDGVAISGATNKDYVITNASTSDAGVYHFLATNSIVTGLTLERHPITLTVSGSTCTVPQSQKDALIALYNATNGANWTNTLANNQPWDVDGTLGIPVCDWYGIEQVLNGSVISIDLNNNNLSGTIPSEFVTGLPFLVFLRLSNNELEGSIPTELTNSQYLATLHLNNNDLSGRIPDFTPTLSNQTGLSRLKFDNNEFIFSDFENEHVTYYTNLITLDYTYRPQAKVDQEETVNVTEGGSITLTSNELTSTNNSYQWYKDGVAISGATSKDYVIANASTSDTGVYHFWATNSIVNGLALERHPITLNVDSEPTSKICLTGFSRTAILAWHDINLSIGMKDGSLINSVTATIVSGLTGGSFVPINEPFDSQGNIVFEDNNGNHYPFAGFEIEYEINSTSGTHIGTELVLSNQNNGAYDHIFECDPYSSPNNIFCLYQLANEPLVENLTPSGPNIYWYATETGGNPYNNTDEIIEAAEEPEGTTYWWDDTTDNIDTRTPVTVKVVIDVEGDTEQWFSIYASPPSTIADIEVLNGDDPIYWYASNSDNTTLDINTPLIDGTTYYASSCDATNNDCECRLPVTVRIGVIPPKGDRLQYVCEQSKLEDIILEIENVAGMSVVWYDSEIGGNTLRGDTAIMDGTTYYASQIDANGEQSPIRLPVKVLVKTTPNPIVKETTQTFYDTDGATISHLKADGRGILWYSQPEGGTPFTDPNYPLEHNTTYYAEQVFGGCPSTSRVAITVMIVPEPDEPLYGCEMFRPELNQKYVIDAWVNEREVTISNSETIAFNDSKESEVLLALLNHLKNRFMSEEKDLRNIPSEYEPEFMADEVQHDLGPLMAYIEGLSSEEDKLIVYDFSPITDNYGRAIGFSFHLSAEDRGTTTNQFVYRTPTYTYSIPENPGSAITPTTKTEHYPLLDNTIVVPNDHLNFTGVELSGATLIMHADFNPTGESLITQNSEESSIGLVKSTITIDSYAEVAYQAVPNYLNTSIEVSIVDEEGNTIETQTYTPHGEIIDKWQKISGIFEIPNGAGRLVISLINNDASKVAYFDDLRIFPHEGNMKTFVYHPENQRLVSELDENNYATFYEYDSEGGLIRVKKETVKGTYTIQETRSNNVKTAN